MAALYEQDGLWAAQRLELDGPQRDHAERLITRHHYAHSVPSGKSRYYRSGDAIVVLSLPANNNVAGFLLGPALGYTELMLPGRHRYARGLTHRARRTIAARTVPFTTPEEETPCPAPTP